MQFLHALPKRIRDRFLAVDLGYSICELKCCTFLLRKSVRKVSPVLGLGDFIFCPTALSCITTMHCQAVNALVQSRGPKLHEVGEVLCHTCANVCFQSEHGGVSDFWNGFPFMCCHAASLRAFDIFGWPTVSHHAPTSTARCPCPIGRRTPARLGRPRRASRHHSSTSR